MSETASPGTKSRSGGIFGLLLGIVLRPRAALMKVDQRGGASWWLPLLLSLVMVVLPIAVGAPILAREARKAVTESQEQMAEQRGVEISAEQQEQIESIAANPLIIIGFPAVLAVIGQIVGWLLWTGALYLAGIALGGRSPFGSMLRVVAWGSVPVMLRGVIQTVSILVTGEMIANKGLSGFAGESVVLNGFLSGIDIFAIWRLILLVIGIGVVTHLSRRKSVLVTLGVWALFTAVGLVFAYLGTMVGQQFGAM
ncbi:MAG: YIP1 family protein [Anaerolineae bacterium]|nr:YIP1 family protein [Anaerolineae bacterium]